MRIDVLLVLLKIVDCFLLKCIGEKLFVLLDIFGWNLLFFFLKDSNDGIDNFEDDLFGFKRDFFEDEGFEIWNCGMKEELVDDLFELKLDFFKEEVFKIFWNCGVNEEFIDDFLVLKCIFKGDVFKVFWNCCVKGELIIFLGWVNLILFVNKFLNM